MVVSVAMTASSAYTSSVRPTPPAMAPRAAAPFKIVVAEIAPEDKSSILTDCSVEAPRIKRIRPI
ncbi:hypothetical protein [Streptococcus azizii]|uniref:hypothetical protein n=1 Tax=Streptococcus azizii TaxID=1579424 RepID=UPI002118526A